ncbi:hypothetical protein K8R66_04860 [bacterium]|nr:hypothetical protein [bacterium]
MKMFNQKFNPEFHWQTEKKEQNNKKYLLLLLILSVIFILLFIFFKSYFISDKNIILEELIPDNAQAVLGINDFQKFIGNYKDSEFLKNINKEMGNYLSSSENIGFTDQINKGFYWAEFSADSQIIILGVDKFSLKSFLNDSNVNFEIKDDQIYKLSSLELKNRFLNSSEGNIYLTQANDYILIVSNNLDKIRESQNKYRNSRRWDYWKSLKDDFNKYFKNQTDLEIKVNDYELIAESNSFLKDLSFLTKNLEDRSFSIKIAVGNKSTDIYIENYSDINNKLLADNYINDFYQNLPHDFVSFYDLRFNNRNFSFSSEVSAFLGNNIENIYNINIVEDLQKIDNGSLLLFKNNKFMAFSPEKQALEDVYRKILAFSSPNTRTVVFPDQSRAVEYYFDPNSVELKVLEENNISWFYANQADNMGFELVKCNDYYIFGNFRDKILDFCNNNAYSLNKNQEYSEILLFNASQMENSSKYLPFLDKFTRNYNYIDLINFSNNGHIEVFFKFRF